MTYKQKFVYHDASQRLYLLLFFCFYFNVSDAAAVLALKMKTRLICNLNLNQVFYISVRYFSQKATAKNAFETLVSFPRSAISYASWDRVTLRPRWKGCARLSNEGASRRQAI